MFVPREYTIDQELPPPEQPLLIRILAHFFSIVFHPLFIPVMVIAYLTYLQPGFFTGISSRDKSMIIARVALNTVFFPLVTVLLLKAVGFIKSVYLRTRRERIIPYVASNIYYFWIFLVFKNQPEVPTIAVAFILGVFLASSAGLLLNSFFKISMHALGMGAFLGVLLVIVFSGYPYGTFLPLMIVVLLSGLVCTSRMILRSHVLFDIYSGILIGILSQMIAYFIIA